MEEKPTFTRWTYRVVKGEVRFKTNTDRREIDDLIDEWSRAVLLLTNILVRTGRLPQPAIDAACSKLSATLTRTATQHVTKMLVPSLLKNYAPGKRRPFIITTADKAEELRQRRVAAITRNLGITTPEAVRRLEKSYIVGLKRNVAQLNQSTAKFKDNEFRKLVLTTLTPRHTVTAEFRCSAARRLAEAKSSPHINEKPSGRKEIQTCGAKLIRQGDKYLLHIALRKAVKLPSIKHLADMEELTIAAVDLNRRNVTIGIQKLSENQWTNTSIKQFTWSTKFQEKVRAIDAKTQKKHGTHANSWLRWMRRRSTSIAAAMANRIVRYAADAKAQAIALEDLRNLKTQRQTHLWNRAKHRQYIENTAAWHGIATFYINPNWTSKTCPICRHRPLRKLQSRQVKCPECGYTDDRDITAVQNISNRFQRILQHIHRQQTTAGSTQA